MQRFKDKLNEVKAESEALRQMIIQCRCGLIASVPDIQNQIQQQKQATEQLQTGLTNLLDKLRDLKQGLDALFTSLEIMQRNLTDNNSSGSSNQRGGRGSRRGRRNAFENT